MTTVPPKHHQPLHNFSLPFLKWGHTIHHRRRSPNSDHNNRTKPHTQTETDQQNAAVLLEAGNSNGNGKLIDVDVVTAVNGDVKPWNLRPRRFVIDTVDSDTVVKKDEEQGKMKMKKRRLWISLSKEEIEEDIYAFTGSKPSRRPKKRNKIAQKQLDNVFPGLCLVGISADEVKLSY